MACSAPVDDRRAFRKSATSSARVGFGLMFPAVSAELPTVAAIISSREGSTTMAHARADRPTPNGLDQLVKVC